LLLVQQHCLLPDLGYFRTHVGISVTRMYAQVVACKYLCVHHAVPDRWSQSCCRFPCAVQILHLLGLRLGYASNRSGF
jgi:hypothetical protein